MKSAWAAKENQHDDDSDNDDDNNDNDDGPSNPLGKKNEGEVSVKTRTINQNDLLATRRSDLVEDDEDDEDAENRSDAWMTNQLKFVRHFEVCSLHSNMDY